MSAVESATLDSAHAMWDTVASAHSTPDADADLLRDIPTTVGIPQVLL